MPRKKGLQNNAHWRDLDPDKLGTRKGHTRPEAIQPAQGHNLAACRDLWLQHLHVRNYKPRTITGRRRCLLHFLEWAHLRDLNHPEHITKKILQSYQRHLHHLRKSNGQPLTIKTQKDRLGAVQHFFSYLCRHDYLPANPAADLELPRGEQRLPKEGFTREEIKTLLNLPNIHEPLGLRDRALLETLYATGIRRSEAVRLQLGDLNLQRKTLFIRQAKGNKDRHVPTGQRALSWIQRYLDQSRPQLETATPSQALFLTTLGQAFNPDALGRLVAKLINQAIPRGGSCHLLRHTCATHMLENGADIRLIQQLLGHAKLDTTALYAQVTIHQLLQIHSQTHPSEINENTPKKPDSKKTPP